MKISTLQRRPAIVETFTLDRFDVRFFDAMLFCRFRTRFRHGKTAILRLDESEEDLLSTFKRKFLVCRLSHHNL